MEKGSVNPTCCKAESTFFCFCRVLHNLHDLLCNPVAPSHPCKAAQRQCAPVSVCAACACLFFASVCQLFCQDPARLMKLTACERLEAGAADLASTAALALELLVASEDSRTARICMMTEKLPETSRPNESPAQQCNLFLQT